MDNANEMVANTNEMPNEMANEMVAKTNEIANNVESSILDFLVNPMYHMKKQKELKKDNSADIKFYRKRIISLCKEMLKGHFESQELKQIHENYVIQLISYFKMKDTSDILQAQYDSKQENTPSAQPKEAQQTEAQAEQAQPTEVQPMEAQTKEITNTEHDINKNLMRKKNTSTLDNYVTVVKKETEKSYPVKKEINLKTSSLKNKGVRNRK
jgi:hypothetical protein